MSRTLVIKPSGLPELKNRPWRLVLRQHDLGGVDYETVALLTDYTAVEIVEASGGMIKWLYGEPDWALRERTRALEKARVMHEEAAKIEAAYRPRVQREVVLQVPEMESRFALDMGGSTPHSG